MTDTSPGPGWWLASDGNWYPPHLHPAYDARPADTLVDDAPPDDRVEDGVVAAEPPLQLVPEREPIDWAKVAEERAARRKAMESSSNTRGIVGAVIAAAGVLLILVFIARNVGDDDRKEAEDAAAATTTTSVAPATSTTAAAATTVTTPGTVSVFTLQPGTCVNNADLASGLVTTVTEVPCDQPHSHEVYHKVTYTPPDGAYDAARISQFATEQCSQSFATYVGVAYDRSQYYFLNFAPTQESWTQKGDREVVCLLFLQGSELTGSAKGTAK